MKLKLEITSIEYNEELAEKNMQENDFSMKETDGIGISDESEDE